MGINLLLPNPRFGVALFCALPFSALLLCALILSGCGTEIAEPTSGSETGNAKVSGRITDEKDNGLANIDVRLYPADYNPLTDGPLPDSLTTTTNASGDYVFEVVDTGSYNIEAVDSQTEKTMARTVSISDDSVSIPDQTLRLPGSVSVTLPSLPDGNPGYLYIPGTAILREILPPQTMTFQVVLVPISPGEYPQLIFTQPAQPDVRHVLAVNFTVVSGDTLFLEPDVIWDVSPGIAGILVHEDGVPAAGVRVELYPENYNPLLEDTHIGYRLTQTDSLGAYRFAGLDSGTYFLEARETSTGRKRRRPLFDVSDSTLNLGTDTLKETGSVLLPIPPLDVDEEAYLHIPHSTFLKRVHLAYANQLQILLDSIPAGRVDEIILASTPDLQNPSTLADSLELGPGELLILNPYRSWTYSQTLSLNTTNINGDVTDFPLLIRLNDQNFDFTQPGPSGQDLRFAKPNGVALDYETELWTDSSAAIWVRLDTVYGNSTAQTLVMYWGASAPARENPHRVFSTDNGFAGVWHLGESASGTGSAGLYQNSANDENHGDDEIASDVTTNFIGGGLYMTYVDHIPVPNATNTLKPDTTVMVSAWVRYTAAGPEGGDVLSMGDDYLLRVQDTSAVTIFNYNEPYIAYDHYTVSAPVDDDVWHYLVGIHTASGYAIYVDGLLLGTAQGPGVIHYDLNTDLAIGAHGNNKDQYNYQGYLDEVRVSTVERSAAWIRLCYENQREGSDLVVFE